MFHCKKLLTYAEFNRQFCSFCKVNSANKTFCPVYIDLFFVSEDEGKALQSSLFSSYFLY